MKQEKNQQSEIVFYKDKLEKLGEGIEESLNRCAEVKRKERAYSLFSLSTNII